ncbi:ABC transporter ATP-binding protein [Haloplasma contractile]|uniref:ATP-binding cassette subfamily B bacterial MsbA protein n=1 Tax=Haloplasma contractile SSD-17B TaxID=1033810 RepID=U2FJY9_9MOLU|nr:ABC transporter ATP-binding protein [Haloplasma contractile]ERJ11544.1 ATP-binding cassette subfamily B bacterial MsbA protein [Haloplasma contractile SSD-17B]
MMQNNVEEQDYNTKFNKDTWIKIFKFMGPLKKYAILGVVFVILIAAMDAVFPLMDRFVIDKIITNDEGIVIRDNIHLLKWYAGVYGVFAILQAFFIYMFIKNAGTIEVELSYSLRKAAFEKLQSLSFSYFNKTPVGWIMARLTSDARRLSEIISWGLIDLSWGFMMMVFISGVMFAINPQLALITLAVVPLLAVVSIYFRKLILKLYREVRKINSKITGSFNEGISGAKTTKTLVLEEKNLNEFDRLTQSMRGKSVKAQVFSSLFFPLVMTLGTFGTALALYYGGNAFVIGVISLGTLQLFIRYSTQFFEPILQLARILAELQQAQASAERIMSLIETDPDIVDGDEIVKQYGDFLNFNEENWEPLVGNIDFENITFRYSEEGETILDDFNLSVNAGETIALVGETGAGKSTIVNLVCRFFEPTEGRILIDGKDYRERSLGWLHSNLGYVLQSPHLFSGTIMENIRYGRLDATDDEVIEAAKLVDAHEFITHFEDGYLTDVGEGGGRLSTGQKQLISFARAILADPAILVLDEATSSIDTETEKKVQSALNTLLEGRTSFIIAHRLSTIVNADQIIVLRKGKILEQGTHDELIENGKYYYSLYTNQFVEEKTQSLGY